MSRKELEGVVENSPSHVEDNQSPEAELPADS